MTVFALAHLLPLSQVQLAFFRAWLRARDGAFVFAFHRHVGSAHHAPHLVFNVQRIFLSSSFLAKRAKQYTHRLRANTLMPPHSWHPCQSGLMYAI
jgi:hypothetical protein